MNGLRREVRGNSFHKSTLVSSLQPVIRVTKEFLLIFGETNFAKIHKIHKICSSQKSSIRYEVLLLLIVLLYTNPQSVVVSGGIIAYNEINN